MEITIRVNNIISQILDNLPQDVQLTLKNELSYVVSGSVFSEYSKQGMWDGTKNLYSPKTQEFPTGLLSRCVRVLTQCGYKLKFNDDRTIPVGSGFSLKNIKLRDYQNDAVNTLVNKTRGLLMAGTGAGKSIVIAGVLAKLGVRSLVIVPSTVLLHQTASDLERVLGVSVGTVGDGERNIKNITVSTFQSLTESDDTKKRKFDTDSYKWKTVKAKKVVVREDLKKYLSTVECVLVDECFPYNTTVLTESGRIPIGKIVNQNIPTKVWSFNTETNKFELKPILRYFKKRYGDYLIDVKYSNSSHTASTPNHPYYVYKDGKICKVRADELKVGDLVVSMVRNGTPKDNIPNALSNTQLQVILGSIMGDGSLRKEEHNCRLSITQGEKQLDYLNWKKTLLGNAVTCRITSGKSGYCDNNVYKFSTRILPEINKYSNSINTVNKVLNDINELGVAIWFMDDGSLVNGRYRLHTESYNLEEQELMVDFFKRKFGITPKILKYKEYYYLQFCVNDSKIISKLLCKYIPESMQYKLYDEDKGKYSYIKDSELDFGVSEIKSIGTVKNSKKYVYNIEVEGNHNYLVNNNKLVSNCHHSASSSIQRVLEACTNAYYRYGFSATPFNNRDEDVLTEASIGRVVKEITASYLIKHGWLSKPTIHLIPFKQKRGSEYTKYADLYEEKITNNDDRNELLRKIIEYRADLGDSVLVSVRYLEHGKILYNKLVGKYGDDVVFLNSKISTQKINETLERLSNKELKICIGTSLLNEGVNLPSLNTLVMAGTPKSKIATMQLVGRVLRKTETKNTVDVYDIQDYNTKYFSSASKERFNIYCSESEFVMQEDHMFDITVDNN